jgi:SHS2 domain-containing protein
MADSESGVGAAARGEGEGFETFDHTGDLGLAVWAPTAERLFGLAAEALMAQVASAGPDESEAKVELSLTGDDPADLLVHWLNQALLESTLKNAIWTRAVVTSWTPRSIEATLQGPRLDPRRHVLLREVKAVSHHDLDLRLEPPRCSCRLVLDI